MNSKHLFWGALVVIGLSLTSCQEKEFDYADLPDELEFYATIEQAASETKVFADDKLRVLWHADDRIAIFNKLTYGYQYRFKGQTGDNSGAFAKIVTDDEFVTGNELPYIYAVYPYAEGISVTNDGVFQVNLPVVQTYAETSFGRGANTMVSVSEDNVLLFRNASSYLSFKLTGTGRVSSITLRGNGGEALAGKAEIEMDPLGTPSVTMLPSATGEVTLSCQTPVELSDTPIEFWLALPPTTFSQGFTVTVRDSNGHTFEKSTSKSLSLERNHISRMAAFEVVLSGESAEPEAVDLGLSVKWASFNLGASSPEEYGDYYAWGETEPKSDYSWETYKWCNGTNNSLTKYNRNSSSGTVDNKTVLDPEDDAACFVLGGSWRMPSDAEWLELQENCTWEWTTVNEVQGYKVTSNLVGYTDRWIFIPAAGYRFLANVKEIDSKGRYWSSSLSTTNPWLMYFTYDGMGMYLVDRCLGQSIRPVFGDRADNTEVTINLHATVKWDYALDKEVDHDRYYLDTPTGLQYQRSEIILKGVNANGEDVPVSDILNGGSRVGGLVPADFVGKTFSGTEFKDVLGTIPKASYSLNDLYKLKLENFSFVHGNQNEQYRINGQYEINGKTIHVRITVDFTDRFRDAIILAGEDYTGNATYKIPELNTFKFKLLGGSDVAVDGTYYDGVSDGSYQGETPELLETIYNVFIEKGIFTTADFATADDAYAAGGEFKTYKGADTTEPDFFVAGVRGKFKMKTYGHGVSEAWARDRFTSTVLKSKAQTYHPDEYIVCTYKTYCGQVIKFIWSVDVERYDFRRVDSRTQFDDYTHECYCQIQGAYDDYFNLSQFTVENVRMRSVMSIVDDNGAVINPEAFNDRGINVTWNITEYSGDDHFGIYISYDKKNDATLLYDGRDDWVRIMADLSVISGLTPFEMPTRFDAGQEYENGLVLYKFSPLVAEKETIVLSLVNDFGFDIHRHQVYNINLLKGVKLFDKRGKIVFDGQNYVSASDPGFTHAGSENFAANADSVYNIDLATALNVTNVVCSTAELQALVDCPNPAEPWNWTFDYSSNVPLYDPTTIEFDAMITTDWQILYFHFIVNVPVTVD